MFGICVFGNSSYCLILHQDFWLMQMDLCLELGMGNYLGFFLVEVWSLLELRFSLDPAKKANTALHNVATSQEIA